MDEKNFNHFCVLCKLDNYHKAEFVENPVPLHKPHATDEHIESVAHNMAALIQQLGAMETFIKRRFDEISMEINATSQQIDISEGDMTRRFGEILGVMNAISFSGDGTTPANTGVELETVIAETAKAANIILDSCDRMNGLLSSDETLWANSEKRKEILLNLQSEVQDIMLACSFQDIAGQRIRKTLENISDIEDRLNSTLESMGIGPETLQAAITNNESKLKSGSTQDEIDELFGN